MSSNRELLTAELQNDRKGLQQRRLAKYRRLIAIMRGFWEKRKTVVECGEE